ncbi:lanthionine synthetase LanC family protein [Chryseobacterium sp. S90]|uniref:lanthionine synthetase LanC family protein n=1 Tax=Chryseobacterium sp. S90 TaxID=3395373 RepID=UPI0039BCF110
MQKEKLIISEIEECIRKKDTSLTGIGLNNGILSASMFYYYHYLMTKESESLELVTHYIEKSLSVLTEDYKSLHFNDEIRELGLYLMFLKQEEVLDSEIDSLLENIDEILEEILIQKTEQGDLDLTSGFPSFAKYFVLRNLKDKKYLIEKTLDKVIELTQNHDSGNYWKFDLRDKENPYVELGLGHGTTGVINYLLFLYKNKIYTKESLELIHKGLSFIWSCKESSTDNITLFPFNAFEDVYIDYHNLAYGEIGIGYTFYNAGILLENKDYCDKGLHILLNTTKFKDTDQSAILEPGLIYGSAGLSALYKKLYLLTEKDAFLEAKEYWHEHLLQSKNNESETWAGFKAYYNAEFDNINMALGQGIAGIGITLMNNVIKTNHNYVSFYNYDL